MRKHSAMTRQCRVIPIVATQSISSLRSALGSGEAWRTLLQTLRTRIFLSLSDEDSAEIAAAMCGKVRADEGFLDRERVLPPGRGLPALGRAGGRKGSVGTSKSFRAAREFLFPPRAFSLLPNAQAVLPAL